MRGLTAQGADYQSVTGGYRFLRMRHQYVCLDGNPIVPLLSGKGSLLRHLGLRNLVDLALHHIRVPHPFAGSNVIRLPVYGQFAYPVQRGYLVFDLERGIVTQIFRPELPAARFEAWAQTMNELRAVSFAPAIGEINASAQWCEMSYIEGAVGLSLLASRADEVLASFDRMVLPCLKELLRLKPWVRRRGRDYVDELRAGMKLHVLDAFPEVYELLQRHLNEIDAAFVAPNAAEEVVLTFSHGDFVHPNFIVSGEDLRVVDWDTAGRRSALHDMHAFFFAHMYWRPDVVLSHEAIVAAADRLLDDHPVDRPAILARLDLYRAIYYMERVAMVLTRDFSVGDAEHLRDAVGLHTAFEAHPAVADPRPSHHGKEAPG
ncbi:phosphotransferase [Ectothiorhodospiraceae bacterium 2226]|nr:phosphotransferase [Ectothiorhodospiraceae bacterium 2226]